MDTTRTVQTSVGFAVGVLEGGVEGGPLGEVVGTTVGEGVVGAGVGVLVISVGLSVGPWVGSHCSTGSSFNSISSKLDGTGAEANCFQVNVPYGGTLSAGPYGENALTSTSYIDK